MSLVRKIRGWGSNNVQFWYPHQLTTDKIGRVFIADTNNHRICIHSSNLNHLYNIMLRSMTHPLEVKVSDDRLYVLYPYNGLCMYILTLEGDKLHSLITNGQGMDVSCPWLFCLDSINNLVIPIYILWECRLVFPQNSYRNTHGEKYVPIPIQWVLPYPRQPCDT